METLNGMESRASAERARARTFVFVIQAAALPMRPGYI